MDEETSRANDGWESLAREVADEARRRLWEEAARLRRVGRG